MMVRLESIRKSYTKNGVAIPALVDVSLDLDAGEFVAVQGPSGCGKSTMLLAAGGLLRPDQGRVEIDGQDLYQLPPDARARFRAEKIGFVFQQFHLIPYLSVLENVIAARLGHPPGRECQARQRAEQLLEQFGLNHRRTHRPDELSTGECQRTALARAMLNEPRVILADEPTGNLDIENGQTVMRLLADFASGGGTVLLVTHEENATAVANRVLRLDQGRFVP
jgi:ABC-type lipoprotein export system ATPase subunit